MVAVAENAVMQMGLDINYIRAIKTGDAVNEARRAVAHGARIIVARGYQALLIKEYTNIPVVEMRVTAQELGLLIKDAKNRLHRKSPHIGMVVFRNLLSDIVYLETLTETKISISYIDRNEETDEKVRELQKKDPDIIFGGRVVCQTAERLGYPTMFLSSTEESVRAALSRATEMLHVMEMEEQNSAQFEAVLDTSANAVLKINAEGHVIVINKMMEDLVGKSAEEVTGMSAIELLPGLDENSVKNILSGESDSFSASINLRNSAWMLLMVPIRYDDRITGAIISLQKISSQIGRQQKLFRDMYLDGYNARETFRDFHTENPKMKQMLNLAKKYALSDAPVLLYSGEGTEYYQLAEALHNNSRRKSGPFVSVRIRGMSKEQQMSFLFGEHQGEAGDVGLRGAVGKADNGTLLIKGIEHLTLQAQHQFIRLLRPYAVSRTDARPLDYLDVRMIAVSKVSLSTLISSGRFSEELFYLLSGLTLEIPDLAKRPEDLTYYFNYYFQRYCRKYNRYFNLTQGGRDVIKNLRWEGNLLQLGSFTERLVLMNEKHNIDEVTIRNLYDELYPSSLKKADGRERAVIYRSPESIHLAEVLARHGGNRAEAAKELGISTTTLWRRMKKYGIEPKYDGSL